MIVLHPASLARWEQVLDELDPWTCTVEELRSALKLAPAGDLNAALLSGIIIGRSAEQQNVGVDIASGPQDAFQEAVEEGIGIGVMIERDRRELCEIVHAGRAGQEIPKHNRH